MPETRIGISGWRYKPWRGVFYPRGLPQNKELEFAARQFNSLEINGSFYSLQRPSSYRKWYDAVPQDFRFAVKAGRYITHLRRLKQIETPLANFFASGILVLNEKLGPILWQFPPNFKFDFDRFASFFELLPRDFKSAARLARHHDKKLKERAYLKVSANHRIRHAIEIRNDTFRDKRFIALLRKFSVAAVFADTAGKWPYFEDITADFVYCRLHGDEELYVSGYTDSALNHWAQRINLWRTGHEPPDATRINGPATRHSNRDVFVYFDNDVKVRAPSDAANLAQKLASLAPDHV